MTQRLFGVVAAIALAIAVTQPAHARTSTKTITTQFVHSECFLDVDRPGSRMKCTGGEVRKVKTRIKAAAVDRPRKKKVRTPPRKAAVAYASAGHADSGLVAAARRYIGTNPTGWRSLWCGRFMAMIAPAAARKVKNPNMARDWAKGRLPQISSPQIGAIAVMTRGKRGGHVGVVSGIAKNGDPIIISGNHNRRVGEAQYPRSRIIAYVLPSA